MATEMKFGPHDFVTGDDGVCVLTLQDAFELKEAERFVREMIAYQETHANAVLLVNLTNTETVRPDARKLIIAGVKEKPYPVCFIRASFGMRALVGLMLNASRLLGETLPFAFVDSEEAGRTWAKSAQKDWPPKRAAE